MNILLINPRLKSWSPNIWVPLGVTYIAAVLEQKGHDVEILDLNARQMNDSNLKRRVRNADIVGISGMITEYEEVLKLVEMIKQTKAEAMVVLGGPLATTLPQKLLQISRSDFVVIGEGEKIIVDLISAIEQGSSFGDIKGISYRADNQIVVTEPAEPIASLDSIPFPVRHHLDMKRYIANHFDRFGIKIEGFGKIKSTNLISSRGCPYNCTFCFKQMWGHKWRGRSPENIIAEMEQLYNQYGINGFFFNDDTFVLDRERISKFCELLRQKGLNIVWYCNGRANLMSKELLEAMYSAGCRAIAYGIESGNQQILDSIKKGITLDQVRKVVKWTKEAGINITGYFMIGMLGETKETIRETIAFARELELDFYGFSLTTPLAGTELYDSAIKAGFVPRDTISVGDWSLCVNANLTKDCADADLAAFESGTFNEFYLQKRFGKYYFFNPGFFRETRMILSLRNKEQAKALARKAAGALFSFWRSGEQ